MKGKWKGMLDLGHTGLLLLFFFMWIAEYSLLKKSQVLLSPEEKKWSEEMVDIMNCKKQWKNEAVNQVNW